MKKVPFGLGKRKNKEPVYEMKTIFNIETELTNATQGGVDGTVFENPGRLHEKR